MFIIGIGNSVASSPPICLKSEVLDTNEEALEHAKDTASIELAPNTFFSLVPSKLIILVSINL